MTLLVNAMSKVVLHAAPLDTQKVELLCDAPFSEVHELLPMGLEFCCSCLSCCRCLPSQWIITFLCLLTSSAVSLTEDQTEDLQSDLW